MADLDLKSLFTNCELFIEAYGFILFELRSDKLGAAWLKELDDLLSPIIMLELD